MFWEENARLKEKEEIGGKGDDNYIDGGGGDGGTQGDKDKIMMIRT